MQLAIPETKVANFYSTTDTAVADVAYPHFPCTISAGDGADQREGTRIFPQWLRIRNMVTYTAANAPQGGCFRRIVYIDWGFNGSGTNIMDSTGATNAISNLNKSRIKILRDDLLPVAQQEPLINDTFIDLRSYYAEKERQYIQYSGTLSSDFTTGTICIWYLFSNAVASGNFRYHHQLAFKP